MTKKEQAEMTQLRADLRLAKAFRWSEPVERDLPPPADYRKLSRGYDMYVVSGRQGIAFIADKACSSSIYHGEGWEQTLSQNPRHLFSTRLLALRAARYEMARMYAESLAKIDEEIERELATPSEVYSDGGPSDTTSQSSTQPRSSQAP